MNLPELPLDKANHALYGAGIACAVSFYNPWVAAGVVGAAAVLKEVSDWRTGPHGVELYDALATMFGGVLVLLPQLVKL